MPFHDLSLKDLRDLAESTVTVAALAETGLYRALNEGPATPDGLAERLSLDSRAIRIALPVLEELGYVERSGGENDRYELSPRGKAELGDPDAPEYQGDGLPLWVENVRAWTHLAEVVRSGRPIRGAGADWKEEGPESEAERQAHLRRFMAGMAAAPKKRLDRLVELSLARAPHAESVLDLGGGPGHIARAFSEQGLAATLVDTPEVVEFVREEYRLDGLERLEAVGLDLLEDPLPRGPFDVVLLSNILHMLPADANRELLARVAEVTAPDGIVAIADFVRGRSPRATRFALVMLVRTDGGDTYTFEEHERWLERAGFTEAEMADLDPERQLITARRAER